MQRSCIKYCSYGYNKYFLKHEQNIVLSKYYCEKVKENNNDQVLKENVQWKVTKKAPHQVLQILRTKTRLQKMKENHKTRILSRGFCGFKNINSLIFQNLTLKLAMSTYFGATLMNTITTKQLTTNYIIYSKVHDIKHQYIFYCCTCKFFLEDNMYSDTCQLVVNYNKTFSFQTLEVFWMGWWHQIKTFQLPSPYF